MQRLGLIAASALVVVVQSHSWIGTSFLLPIFLPHASMRVECTNYVIQSDADRQQWNAAQCQGWPRCAATRGGVFGLEGPLQYQQNSSSCPASCPHGSTNEYTTTQPKATYMQGQRVCLAYPAKNHVAAPCTNQYIPDTFMRIFRSELGATVDPPLQQWPVQYGHLNGEHQNGVMDYQGFQNCPAFCDNKPNMDKALCTVCFDLEPDLALGDYSFHWEWRFNPGMDLFVSCWDVTVVPSTPSIATPSPPYTHGGLPGSTFAPTSPSSGGSPPVTTHGSNYGPPTTPPPPTTATPGGSYGSTTTPPSPTTTSSGGSHSSYGPPTAPPSPTTTSSSYGNGNSPTPTPPGKSNPYGELDCGE
ncbi:Aste57867_17362 [Aphanomyces stellatus]|uniref:Aste57867_17362 protein n=1 Tax=Aphanomyces stellatus TaxID=120398 RepID=A0A485L7Q5_9STRA|nr:hypothetical protein As57867_017302 [Aphanomyces stellatus]VFT94118.1 Aste57867_17362 [Aphanomyces stellatus]